MSPNIDNATVGLRNYLFDNIYLGSKAKEEEKKVEYIIRELYKYLINNPKEINGADENFTMDIIHRLACDYIAGMTDRYALNKYKAIFLPMSWQYL